MLGSSCKQRRTPVLYIKNIMTIVGCDMERARRIFDEMACGGLDFSECSKAAFKKAALSAANYVK